MITNKFYKKVFAVDFTATTNPPELKAAFKSELNLLVEITQEQIKPLTSISEVVETFHYSSLAAAFLQKKASMRANELIKTAAPEESIYSMAVSQLGIKSQDTTDDAESAFDSLGYTDIVSIQRFAETMSQDFAYIGRAMRAFVMTCILSGFACKGNSLAKPGNVLKSYEPTALLTNCEDFPVIGYVEENYRYNTSSVHSLDNRHHSFKAGGKSNFGTVFAMKLAELLAADSMSVTDRARIEEIRGFMLDTYCRSFFELRSMHLNRVFSLVATVNEVSDKNSGVSEETLNAVTPAECAALLQRESIITKTLIDTEAVWYRVNHGIKSFAALVERFRLLDGYTLALMRETVATI